MPISSSLLVRPGEKDHKPKLYLLDAAFDYAADK
jgi:hypothetical protein